MTHGAEDTTLKRDVEEFFLNFKEGKITVMILQVVFYCTAESMKNKHLRKTYTT